MNNDIIKRLVALLICLLTAFSCAFAEDGSSLQVTGEEILPDYTILMDKLTTDKPLGIQETERVDDSYFDDVLFVGDSVSEKLRTFVLKKRRDDPGYMGGAQFFTGVSFGSRTAIRAVTDSSKHPTYNGKKMTIEDAVVASGCGKVYIMLGMNDAAFGIDKAVENMLEVIRRIKEKAPDVKIFIQSATPRMYGTNPTTKELFKYDIVLYEAVKQLADQDVYFVDVAFPMRDEEGNLKEKLCSDTASMALHLSNSGCELWIEWLYRHALIEE